MHDGRPSLPRGEEVPKNATAADPIRSAAVLLAGCPCEVRTSLSVRAPRKGRVGAVGAPAARGDSPDRWFPLRIWNAWIPRRLPFAVRRSIQAESRTVCRSEGRPGAASAPISTAMLRDKSPAACRRAPTVARRARVTRPSQPQWSATASSKPRRTPAARGRRLGSPRPAPQSPSPVPATPRSTTCCSSPRA